MTDEYGDLEPLIVNSVLFCSLALLTLTGWWLWRALRAVL